MYLLLDAVIFGSLIWFAYKFIRIAVNGVKLGIRQADHLEKKFGHDVLGAAQYMIAGQPGAAGKPLDDPNRMHDDS
jgi:hypothetical protein